MEHEFGVISVVPDTKGVSISISAYSAAFLSHLLEMIYIKGDLISKATSGNFSLSDAAFIVFDQSRESNVDGILRTLNAAGEQALCGLKFENDRIIFSGFPPARTSAELKAYQDLAVAMTSYALRARAIHVKTAYSDRSDKYAFSCWLTSTLKLKGNAYKKTREILTLNLEGSTAFANSEKQAKWTANRKRIKLEQQIKVKQLEEENQELRHENQVLREKLVSFMSHTPDAAAVV